MRFMKHNFPKVSLRKLLAAGVGVVILSVVAIRPAHSQFGIRHRGDPGGTAADKQHPRKRRGRAAEGHQPGRTAGASVPAAGPLSGYRDQ